MPAKKKTAAKRQASKVTWKHHVLPHVYAVLVAVVVASILQLTSTGI